MLLDGGLATELHRLKPNYRSPLERQGLWGTWAYYFDPEAVYQVHRRYTDIGCDLITTGTWSLLQAAALEEQGVLHRHREHHWMDVARMAVRLARRAVKDSGNKRCAVAFSLRGDIDSPVFLERMQLLKRIFREEPPDLILLETLTLIREGLTMPAVELMLDTELPVWLSFRRCRAGVCGVFGQHWGGPEGDAFGRTARQFEKMGVRALLINCLPTSHVPGTLPWLRDFTDMPLGVYPNLGQYKGPDWHTDDSVGPSDYAELALLWRSQGAQLIGGCCGVTPEHLEAAARALENTPRGQTGRELEVTEPAADSAVELPLWSDEHGRTLYPLPFPKIRCENGVFRPTQGSFLMWKYLFKEGIGKDKDCLEVGCGTGILSVQLALNGARRVEAMDIDQAAVDNTMTNAFRNGVADRVQGQAVDLYTYVPQERFDLVVASLYQMPVDPMGEQTSLRPADFWGRNMLDHLIKLLPQLLRSDGSAYLMQISVLSQQRTEEVLARHGLKARVVDFSFFYFSQVFYRNIDQIRRVTEISDAFHMTFGEDELMVMYLLEISRV